MFATARRNRSPPFQVGPPVIPAITWVSLPRAPVAGMIPLLRGDVS